MEVRIRLQKSDVQAKGRYNYRIVAMSRAQSRQGAALEILGHYNAAAKPATYKLEIEKVEKWLAKGAQMSATVRSIVKKLKKAGK